MTIIRVPTDFVVSPEDGTPVKLDTDTRLFRDPSGNECSIDDLVGTRKSNAARKWLDEQFPKSA